jgi:hypothetical protein
MMIEAAENLLAPEIKNLSEESGDVNSKDLEPILAGLAGSNFQLS